MDQALYPPEGWAEAAKRREESGVPEEVRFETKPKLAKRMLERWMPRRPSPPLG